ncbi:MAG: hypothetical protein QXW29_00515 [Thermoplasmatales archaeon]
MMEGKAFIQGFYNIGMKRSLKIGIIASVGAVIVVIATVFAYTVVTNEQASSSPFSYIPSNSSLVLYLNYNNTKAFLFHGTNYTAIMITSVNVKGSNVTIPYDNKTYAINTTLYQTYKGFQIYALNVSSIFLDVKSFSNFSKYINVSGLNDTLFAYEPYGSTIVFGSLQALHISINAYLGDLNFQKNSALINLDNNISFYAVVKNSSSPVIKAWGGLNQTAVYSFLQLKNGTSLNLSYLQNIPGVKVITVGQNELEVIVSLSYLSYLLSKEKIT